MISGEREHCVPRSNPRVVSGVGEGRKIGRIRGKEKENDTDGASKQFDPNLGTLVNASFRSIFRVFPCWNQTRLVDLVNEYFDADISSNFSKGGQRMILLIS